MRARLRGDVVWLVVILGAFAAASFSTLGQQSFDSGETITAGRVLHAGYLATFHQLATSERSGPVYYSLAWAWARLFGTGEAGLRSLSLLFTLPTIIAMYAAGRELLGRRAGVLAALLTACNADVFWFSQEARSYPLYICFCAIGLAFFVRALKRPTGSVYAGWAAAGAVALATHYFSAFFFGLEGLVLIAARRGQPRAPLRATGAIALAGLALLPLAIHQEQGGRVNGFTSVPVLERGASALVKFGAGQMSHPSGAWRDIPLAGQAGGIAVLVLCAGAIAVFFARARGEPARIGRRVALVGAGGFALPLLFALAGFDYVETYNLDGALPPLLLLVACGAELALRERGRLPVRRAAPGAIAAAMAAMIGLTAAIPALQREDFRGLGEAVMAQGRGVVLAQPPDVSDPLSYYLGRDLHGLSPSNYPCGVRARRIVAVSGGGELGVPRFGFTLTQTEVVAGRWTVATYAAPRPYRLDGSRIRALGIESGRDVALSSATRPAAAPRATPAVQRLRRLAVSGSALSATAPGQPPACGLDTARVRLARVPVSRGTRRGASPGTLPPPRAARRRA